MERPVFACALLLAACNAATEDASEEVLAAYVSELGELQEALDAYGEAIATAAEVSAVTDLQSTYDADADHAIEEVGHVLDDIEGCSHMGDGVSKVVAARATLQEMHAAIEDLLTAHASHVETSECVTAGGSHAQTMADHLTTMNEHLDSWNEMTCEMHDDEAAHAD